jgi:hypothetical protein
MLQVDGNCGENSGPTATRHAKNTSSFLAVVHIRYVAEQACKWRGLPRRFGHWHTVYTFWRSLFYEVIVPVFVGVRFAYPDLGGLKFKDIFPDNFKAYASACRKELVKPGHVFVFERAANNDFFINPCPPRWIVNFPTKQHWKGKSRIEWIKAGLDDLVEVINTKRIQSIAIPPLGCGLGGLDWNDVRPLIEHSVGALPDVRIYLCEP